MNLPAVELDLGENFGFNFGDLSFNINAGAQIWEGPAPGFNGAQNLNFGGLLSGYDQVFLGLRWLP